MPDDFIDLNSGPVAEHEFAEESASRSYGLGRWVHFPAMIVFGLFFILLHGNPWKWYIAINAAYTTYVFGFAIGSVIKDLDDVLGDPSILRYAARLLIPHAAVSALLTFLIAMWFHAGAILPLWATTEGRKESLWDFFGWLVLAVAGVTQGVWMAGKFKRRTGKPED
jgi:hypothetical protein